MKNLFLICLMCFTGSSFANAVVFSLGSADATNGCVNAQNDLFARLSAFSKNENISEKTFSVSVAKVVHRKAKSACVAELISHSPNYAFAKYESDEHYGENQNGECIADKVNALKNTNVIGTRTSFNQGWIFNPFCQTFELSVEKKP